MHRYFIELAYNGANYSGFQKQRNANSVQAEVEKALHIFYKKEISLTGSSRTDAGVHSLQNFFHFDINEIIKDKIHNLNAILPFDIVIKKIHEVENNAHCRFDAISREYVYNIYQQKNPFLKDTAYFFPHQLDIELLQKAASQLMQHNDFATFSKKHSQAKTTICKIYSSHWKVENGMISYHVKANRFLRGMVRGLVCTMLQVGIKKISFDQFCQIIKDKDSAKAYFSVPPQGLFLAQVNYPF